MIHYRKSHTNVSNSIEVLANQIETRRAASLEASDSRLSKKQYR